MITCLHTSVQICIQSIQNTQLCIHSSSECFCYVATLLLLLLLFFANTLFVIS